GPDRVRLGMELGALLRAGSASRSQRRLGRVTRPVSFSISAFFDATSRGLLSLRDPDASCVRATPGRGPKLISIHPFRRPPGGHGFVPDTPAYTRCRKPEPLVAA